MATSLAHAALPAGRDTTLTFLFTDIEGSTRRWEEQTQAMRSALRRHDAMLRRAIEASGGDVFKTVGDAFYATFPSVHGALRAAVAAQLALQAEHWEALGALRVRMAVHTGPAEAREGDYFGPALNRVARVLSAGHGGQVLVSAAARELTADALPPGVALRDLGEHRFKDLLRPERIYQLTSAGLPTEFPPLRTLDNRPNNLPAQATLFVGREGDLQALRQLAGRPDVRLVTLLGPGGTGKTRLALQAGADLLDTFNDGVFFVPLEPLANAGLVPATIARVLGITEEGTQPLRERLKHGLRDKTMLLILDNFEQVAAAGPFVTELLAACPYLNVVVTSRALLRVYGEHEFYVRPLQLPDAADVPAPEQLVRYGAIQLFVARAQAAAPGFRLTEANAAAVAAICRRLDGLPLAIELAAARVRLLPPPAMRRRLASASGGLPLLTGGARDLPARQQTLRNVIAWSHDLLNEREQRLFRRLSVFVDGGSLDAAEAICNRNGDLEADVLDEMASLIAQSMLLQEDQPGDGEPRVRMLETIRDFALEQLTASGEADDIRRLHAAFYLSLAEEAERHLTGADQAAWLRRLDAEHVNLRAALQFWRTRTDTAEQVTAARLAAALWRFWWMRGYLAEGREHVAALLPLTLAASAPPPVTGDSAEMAALRAKLLYGAGALAARQGDTTAARELWQACLAVQRGLGDRRGVAMLLNALGTVHHQQGDAATAQRLWEDSLAIQQELGNARGVAITQNNLGILARDRGDYATARVRFEQYLAAMRQLGDRAGMASALDNLGDLALFQGDHAAAGRLYEESLAIAREMEDRAHVANTLCSLGNVAREAGERDAARARYADSLRRFVELGSLPGLARVLEGAAGLAAIIDRPEQAYCLAGAAAALREQSGTVAVPDELAMLELRLDPYRRLLGDERAAAAMAEGRRLMPEEAAARVLA